MFASPLQCVTPEARNPTSFGSSLRDPIAQSLSLKLKKQVLREENSGKQFGAARIKVGPVPQALSSACLSGGGLGKAVGRPWGHGLQAHAVLPQAPGIPMSGQWGQE